MNIEEELKKRFAKAVKELIRPPVLFGPKWVQPSPTGPPGQYQFIGAGRVAKATGIDRRRIAEEIIDCVKLGGLNMTIRLTPSGVITLTPSKKAGKRPSPPAAAKAKPDKKKPSGKTKAAPAKKKPASRP